MKTKAVRLYGKSDIRLEEFELPVLRDDEILAEVISDSACMSSYKAVTQGPEHKRVPDDVDRNPIIIGHEFCGRIIEVGEKWKKDFAPGERFSIQPALNYKGSLAAPGYSYRYIGGDATYVIIPNEVMECSCLLKFTGEGYFMGSLAEPLSCVIGAFHANYHMAPGSYEHKMGIKEGGKTAIIGGVGPMGLCALELALHGPRNPGLLVVTDIDGAKLARAASVYPPEEEAKRGITLKFVNTSEFADPAAELVAISGGSGFDDVFCMAPVRACAEQSDAVLARDGCLNFFAGPANPAFSAEFNFYRAHYSGTHICATSGGNNDDLREALELMSAGRLNPVAMITHIGGLDATVGTVLNLPKIPGGKKLIYTHKSFPLVALDDLSSRSEEWMRKLGAIVEKYGGRWSAEAENYLLENAPDI